MPWIVAAPRPPSSRPSPYPIDPLASAGGSFRVPSSKRVDAWCRARILVPVPPMTMTSFADKSGWGDGPWQSEPDRVAWVDSETRYPCLILRGPVGALNGYVAIPPSHPWHGVGWSDHIGDPCDKAREEYGYCEHTPESIVRVHGGLTYSGLCDGDMEQGICHVPAPGTPDDVWWFGFDCAHAGDVAPMMYARFGPLGNEVYRDVDYVGGEVLNLAVQLAVHGLVGRGLEHGEPA